MPPKKKPSEPSKKTEQKQKAKVIEDKTFGLKNKKGAKTQKYVQQVEKQVTQGNIKTRQLEKEKEKLLDAKKRKEQDDLNALFKPVEQKIGKGVDPKSVVCAFFKQGQCGKGAKCKFSHDLNVSRKGEKRNIYEDAEVNKDDMSEWDEAKLEEVVNTKHGASNCKLPQTSIICKFFLDAVENNKYGWFWECQNGAKCHYRHALPPGFVLKRDAKKEDKVEQISLEELVEKERAALNSANLTKVTLETFLKWKERKRREKVVKFNKLKDKKKSDFKSGKILGISGRELFEFNPDLVAEDDDEADDIVYKRDDEDEDGESGTVYELKADAFNEASYVPMTAGTVAPPRVPNAAAADDETSKLDEAAALPGASETEAAIAAAMAATVNGIELAEAPIDDDLFDGEDLDLVEDELETLDLED